MAPAPRTGVLAGTAGTAGSAPGGRVLGAMDAVWKGRSAGHSSSLVKAADGGGAPGGIEEAVPGWLMGGTLLGEGGENKGCALGGVLAAIWADGGISAALGGGAGDSRAWPRTSAL